MLKYPEHKFEGIFGIIFPWIFFNNNLYIKIVIEVLNGIKCSINFDDSCFCLIKI